MEKVTRMVSKNIPERFGFDPFQDIQVLTPMHRGVTGSINLNRSLQSVLNPDGTDSNIVNSGSKPGTS